METATLHYAGLRLALDIAQTSTMRNHVGCVIIDRRTRRVVCDSANYAVGPLIPGTNSMTHATMHSEMGAIEKLFASFGRVQDIHAALRRKRRHQGSLRAKVAATHTERAALRNVCCAKGATALRNVCCASATMRHRVRKAL